MALIRHVRNSDDITYCLEIIEYEIDKIQKMLDSLVGDIHFLKDDFKKRKKMNEAPSK